MRRILAPLIAFALLVPAAAPAADPVGIAAQKISAGDNVYVDPGAETKLTRGQVAAVKRAIDRDAGGQMYVAVLPASVAGAAGGAAAALNRFHAGVGFEGVYVLVAGRTLQAGGTDVHAGPLATAAVEAHKGDGLAVILEDLAKRVGDARSGGGDGSSSSSSDGHSFGAAGWIVPLVILLGGGFLLLGAQRRRRRAQQEALDSIRDDVRDELIALGEDIGALEVDVQMPNAPAAARDHYAGAVAAYDRANEIWQRARRPEDMAPVGQSLEEGRWAIAATRAALAGQAEPERRPPCFFDPRHGPSVRDVEWAPPGGRPRAVPACAADAIRVEEGEDPEYRELAVGGQRVPWFMAGPAYAPFMGGWMGGFGGFGTGLLAGMLLEDALTPDPVWGAGGWDGWDDGYDGDFDGGGYDGGGDFGGGDFGGGDFGGGDFGGGGGDF